MVFSLFGWTLIKVFQKPQENLKKEMLDLKQATADMSLTVKVLLGISISTLIGVFIPLFAINLTGTWLGSISAYGDHALLGGACVVAGLLGLKLKRLWLWALIAWAPVFCLQFFVILAESRFDQLWGAWPAITRSVGAFVLSTLFLGNYRKNVLDD